jgi:hypothetical protein
MRWGKGAGFSNLRLDLRWVRRYLQLFFVS